MEDPAPSASPLSPQDQARIRRERRQAKVKAGGTSRLNRITSTQGTNASYRDEDSSAATTTTEPPPRADDSTTPDPPEIDISQHHYEPKSRQQERAAFENIFAGMSPAPASFRNTASSPSNFSLDQDSFAGGAPSDAELRQMMMMGGHPMFQQQQQPQGGLGGASQEGMDMGMGDVQQDPMMQMMQQIMGGAGGMPGMPGMPGMMGQQVHPRVDTWAKWWKMLHAFGAVLLALWALSSTGWRFSGSLSERVESAGLTKGETPQLFWYFTTMELVLQSSRFFLEKGRPPPGSWLSTIGGFLPHPFGTFLITLARYSVIWTTIMADAGVLIFCLGVAAWWNK